LLHPKTGSAVTFEASAPRAFDQWLRGVGHHETVYDDPSWVRDALATASERRWGILRATNAQQATTAFRLVHEAGDALPELAVDVYDEWLVAQLYGDEGAFANAEKRERVLDALGSLGARGVYLKVRPKQANTLVSTRRDNLAPPLPVRGEPAPDELCIHENGIPYGVRLGDGLSTGIFLDQRATRQMIRSNAEGRTVANLFAYTCAFSVAAAVGQAARTVSVDAALPALAWGRENLNRVGAHEKSHELIRDDVFAWLKRAKDKGHRFDIVVCDPPSYATTEASRFAASTDYPQLAADALAIVAPAGMLVACTNHRKISRQRFRKMLHDALRMAKREVIGMRDLPAAPDFPAPWGLEPHLKVVMLRVK